MALKDIYVTILTNKKNSDENMHLIFYFSIQLVFYLGFTEKL